MDILNREFWEFVDWKFTLTETAKQTYTIDIESSLIKLKEIKAEIDRIPNQIAGLEKRKIDITKFYNEWLATLVEAKENYKWEDLELPEQL